MLSDLKGLCVHIMCANKSCGRVMAKRADELMAELGDLSLEELSQRMVCRKCGARGPILSPWTGGPFPPLRG